MQTGERQAARLRMKYLNSILKKDIHFFDTKAKDCNIIFHISSDMVLVQDAIGDKVDFCTSDCLRFIVLSIEYHPFSCCR